MGQGGWCSTQEGAQPEPYLSFFPRAESACTFVNACGVHAYHGAAPRTGSCGILRLELDLGLEEEPVLPEGRA